MPATPFIGISVVIHVVIILFHKIFKIKDKEPKPISAITYRQYVISFSIVLVMFSIMLYTAYGLLSASVHESHSTVYLVEDTAQWMMTEGGSTQIAAAITGTYKAQAAEIGFAVLILIGIVVAVPRIRFPRSNLNVPQSGHSIIQTILLIGGVLLVLGGGAYIVLYLVATSAH